MYVFSGNLGGCNDDENVTKMANAQIVQHKKNV